MRTPILAALVSALLFGVSTPMAKVLVAQLPPLALASLLYLGAGLGLLVLRWLWRSLGRGEDAHEAPVTGRDWGWLAGAILAGGVVAPVLLINLTRRVSGSDPMQVAGLKGLVAGGINHTIAVSTGWTPPAVPVALATLGVGLLGYGVSLSLFVWALRHLGTARTGAYFSVAPFFGATTAVLLLAERPGALFWVAALLMAIGVWLHVTERHDHPHRHESLTHTHMHRHDEHHQHEHPRGWDGVEPHTHEHEHAPLVHTHPHYLDLHHRHGHG